MSEPSSALRHEETRIDRLGNVSSRWVVHCATNEPFALIYVAMLVTAGSLGDQREVLLKQDAFPLLPANDRQFVENCFAQLRAATRSADPMVRRGGWRRFRRPRTLRGLKGCTSWPAFFEQRAKQNTRAFLQLYVYHLVRQSVLHSGDVASDEVMALALRAAEGARELQRLFGHRFAIYEGHIHFHAAVLHRSRGELGEARRCAGVAVERFEAVLEQTATVLRWKSEVKQFLEEIKER